MKKLLAGILVALLSFPVFAGFKHQVDKDTHVTGLDTPCKTNLDPMFVIQLSLLGVPVNDFKQAEVIYKGNKWQACWVEAGKSQVFIADEKGNAGFIDLGPAI